MLSTTTWDRIQLVGIAAVSEFAIREWLKSSIQRRGRQLTRRLVARITISTGAGLAISLLTLGLAHYSRNHEALAIPMMPGLFLGAITVGAHRNDNLLLYVTGFLNTALYGAIVFGIYPIFRRDKNANLS